MEQMFMVKWSATNCANGKHCRGYYLSEKRVSPQEAQRVAQMLSHKMFRGFRSICVPEKLEMINCE